MLYLCIYLLTILLSIAGETLLTFKMIRDVADAGYLIDKRKFDESLKKIKEISNADILLNNKLIKFIPIVNLLNLLKMYDDYNKSNITLISQLSIMGVLNEMTEEEKKEYSKKPTALKAIKIDANREMKLKEPTTSILKIENGVIWFEKSDRDYNILKASGSAEKMSRFTQVKLIEDYIERLIDEGLKVYGNDDTFLKVIKDCDNYNQLEQKIRLQKLAQRIISEFPELKEKIERSLDKENSIINMLNIILNKNDNNSKKPIQIDKAQESIENNKFEFSNKDLTQNNTKKRVRKL